MLCVLFVCTRAQEFTCPICDGGFIEELSPAAAVADPEDIEMTAEPNYLDLSNTLTDQISMMMSTIGGGAGERMDEDGADRSTHAGGEAVGGHNPLFGGIRGRGRGRQTDFLNFDNIMHEFLLQLTGGQGGAGGPMLFMGNPGDYAWGNEGLDSVITQMLNQMENAGPPPLDKDKIDEIPKVEVDEEQIAQKQQCPVCWENFQKSEVVRKLPCMVSKKQKCGRSSVRTHHHYKLTLIQMFLSRLFICSLQHIYHENCIVPWLNLHGTCPVCRMTLNKKSEEQTQNNALDLSNMSDSIGNQVMRVLHNLRPELSAASGGAAAAAVGTSRIGDDQPMSSQRQTRSSTRRQSEPPSATSTQSSSSHDNNDLASRRDPDGNVEYDFD